MSKLVPPWAQPRGRVHRRLSSLLVVPLCAVVCVCTARAAPTTRAGDKAGGEDSAVRYDRDPTKVRTRRTPNKPGKGAGKPSRPDPAITGRDWERAAVATSVKVIDDLIMTAKRLLVAVDPTNKQYPDYLFRLANLHLDKRQIFELQAGTMYERIHALEQQGNKQEAAQARAQQKRQQKIARGSSIAAVKAFHNLVNDKRHADYERMDEGLYYYASELGALGRDAEMQAAYVRLLRDFPTSSFIPQVYLSFADHKYNAGAIGEALRLYEKIVDGYPGSPVYAYALYKIGWCHLNPVGSASPDYPRSLQSFAAAINATKQGRAGSAANGVQLRREARRDLVKAYVHAARPSRAWAFFGELGNGPGPAENMQRRMMELLADAYYGEGMVVESSATYKTLQTEFPADAKTCHWQARVADNALATDDIQIQWKETKALVARWERFKGEKHAKNAKKKCRNDTADALVRRATTWHDEANNTEREEPYALAASAYAEFLRLFPNHKDAYEMSFYLAEVKWAQAQRLVGAKDRASQERGRALFCESADAFVDTLELNPRGKLTKEAAYAQMLGWKNCTEYDETGAQGNGCEVHSDGTCVYRGRHGRRVAAPESAAVDAAQRFPITEYTEPETHMLAAYDRYLKYVRTNNDPELPKILFHRVRLLVEHHRFKQADPGLNALIDDFDGTRYAAWGAEMLVDIGTIRWADTANDRARKRIASEKLLKLAAKLQTKKLWKHAESARLRTAVPRLVAAVRWWTAGDHCADARSGADPDGFAKCGEAFHAIYEDYPNHDRGDELLYNAAIAFESGYLVGHAIGLRRALIEQHPDSALFKKTLRAIAENYQAIAFYSDAAGYLEQYAETYKRDDYAATALGNAFIFRAALGQDDAARDDLTRYETLFRQTDPNKAAEVYWSRSQLIADVDHKIAHAEAYIDRYGNKGGMDRLAVAHATAGQLLWRASCPKTTMGDACVTRKRTKAMAGQDARTQSSALRNRISGTAKTRCGTATQGVLVVHPRDERLASRAKRHFAAVLSIAAKGVGFSDEAATQRAAFDRAWGMSLVYTADADYEAYLQVLMPEGLDYHVEPWKKNSGIGKWEREYAAQIKRKAASTARFGAFFKRKKALGESLLTAYSRVSKTNSPHWMLAAAARAAVVWQDFADQLYRAEIPKGLRTEDERDSFCFALMDHADPLEKAALKNFEYCLSRSTKFQYFNEFSRMCEEELQQRRPDAYPATNELFGRSGYTDARMDVVGVQTNLQGDRRSVPQSRAVP